VIAPQDPGPEVALRVRGRFQRRNFALACAAAEAFLGRLDPGRVAETGASVSVPGRLQCVGERPPTYVDAAHNAEGAAALAEALPEIASGRPVVACLAMLSDKDAEAAIRALAPALDHAVCTELPLSVIEGQGRPGASSHSAAKLVRACLGAGLAAEGEPTFELAVRRGRELAIELEGVLLVTGSHYAIAPARAALGD
jgi:dihydrofolate synthase/folylpolyglutamate synthase